MSFRIVWHPAARHDFLQLTRSTATNIDAAVIRFAATREGRIERIHPRNPASVRLHADGAVALLYIDFEEMLVHVGRVFRRK